MNFIRALHCLNLSEIHKMHICISIGENIIGTTKIRNKFWCHSKLFIFQYCDSYCSTNFAIAKVVVLNIFASFLCGFMASFLCCFSYRYYSSKHCNGNCCHSYTLLRALVKSNGNLFAIAFKSEKEQ